MNIFSVNGAAVNSAGAAGDPFELRLGIRIRVLGTFELSLPIGITVYTTLPNFQTAQYRRVSVTLAGTNVTSRLVGEVSVEAEEAMARTAQFTISPAAGTVDLTQWVGAEVRIDHDVMSGNTVVLRTRLFTGIVDVPKFNPQNGQVNFRCTDDIQSVFNRRTREDIDLLTPDAYYSSPINGSDLQGYKYMKVREESLTASVDLDPFRRPRVTSWDVGSPDYTFDATGVVHESELVELGVAHNVVNDYNVDFTFRYQRLREKLEYGSWALPGSTDFCNFLELPVALPNREMVLGALRGTGWIPASVNFTPVPESQVFSCPGGLSGWAVTDELRDQLIIGATWTLKKRFSQTVSELFRVRVRAPQSEAGLEARTVTKKAGFTADYDAAPWIAEIEEESTLIGTQQLGQTGDYFEDKDDIEGFSREEAEAGLSWCINNAVRLIRNAHRQNQVAFDVMLNPDIDLDKVVRINTSRIQATGKVKKVTHTIDLSQSRGGTDGNTRTTIQIAVSRSYTPPTTTYDVATDDTTPPTEPDTTDQSNIPALTTNERTTHIGGILTAPPYDETWTGFITNYMSPDYFGAGTPDYPQPGSEIYPVEFVVASPEVPPADVEELNAEVQEEYTVSIPDDELVLVAP